MNSCFWIWVEFLHVTSPFHFLFFPSKQPKAELNLAWGEQNGAVSELQEGCGWSSDTNWRRKDVTEQQ